MSAPLTLPAEVHQRLLDAVPHLIDALVSLAQGTVTTTHERRVASGTLRTRERSYKDDEYERFLFPWREEEEMVLVARDTYKHKPDTRAATALLDLLHNSEPAPKTEHSTGQEQEQPQPQDEAPISTPAVVPPKPPFQAPDRTDDDCSPRPYLPPELIKNSNFQRRAANHDEAHPRQRGALKESAPPQCGHPSHIQNSPTYSPEPNSRNSLEFACDALRG